MPEEKNKSAEPKQKSEPKKKSVIFVPKPPIRVINEERSDSSKKEKR